MGLRENGWGGEEGVARRGEMGLGGKGICKKGMVRVQDTTQWRRQWREGCEEASRVFLLVDCQTG